MPMPPNKTALAVYQWENFYIRPKSLSYIAKDDCVALIHKVCWREGIKIPEVRFITTNDLPCTAFYRDWRIDIAYWGRMPQVILHEVAHLVTHEDVLKAGEDGHGPVFVGKCIDLYHTFLKLPVDYLVETAEKCGVQVGSYLSPKENRTLENTFDAFEF